MLPPVVGFGFGHRREEHDAGIVDEDVEPAKLFG